MNRLSEIVKKYWLLIAILLVGAFLRLYKIDQYLTFLGDEGRDVIIVRNLLVYADPILIGPGTSIGGMYLGPLYYYLIAPSLFLANFSPIGPAVFIALIGVATILLIFKVGKEWFSTKVGYIAAALYAIAPTVIVYSRSSWNPNIMPFFSLLSVYSIWKTYKDRSYKWLIVCAVSFAFVLQSHYLGLLIGPTLLIYWYLSKIPRKYSIYALIIFALLMSPLVIFDFRHDFMNSRALHKFLTVRQETVSIKPWTSLAKIPNIFTEINSSLLVARNIDMAKWVSVFLIGSLIWFRKKLFIRGSPFLLLISWLIFALIGLGLYKQHIYDHYYGFIFPLIFLLAALLISKLHKFLAAIAIGILVSVNLQSNPLMFHPNKQLQRSQNVSNLVLEKSSGQPFDLAVLAERNYEDGYRYFLEKSGAIVLHADKWDQKTIVDQLFVICEMEESKCDPTHSPKAEVANFGMSQIDQKWIVDGVIIYRLLHTN